MKNLGGGQAESAVNLPNFQILLPNFPAGQFYAITYTIIITKTLADDHQSAKVLFANKFLL